MSNASSNGAVKRPNAIIGALAYLKHQTKAEFRKRKWIKNRQRLIADYFASDAGPKMLQTGCGHNILKGWFNTDLNPEHDEVAYLDCTEPFPFDDAVFDYVFTEHQIEHIDYLAGQHMLSECLRVLKPGGKLRIATPNLTNILGLYTPNKTELQQRYLKWSVDRFQKHIGIVSDTFVINNFFRSWGHKFIYDPPTMTQALASAGFENIQQFSPGQSDDPTLKRMETHGKSIESEEFNLFETMVLQAERPTVTKQGPLRTLSAAFNRVTTAAEHAAQRDTQLQV
jgi:predicted SAM-dependent methyltransferase